jgi:hypothetical protein
LLWHEPGLHTVVGNDATFRFRITRHVVVDVDVVIAFFPHVFHTQEPIAIPVSVVANVMVHMICVPHHVHMVQFETIGTARQRCAVAGQGSSAKGQNKGRREGEYK